MRQSFPQKSTHSEAIEYFNSLLMDLQMQIIGEKPMKPIDMNRLNEGTKHLLDISRCTEPIKYS